MKKLSKTTLATHRDAVDALAGAHCDLSEAIEQYNEAIAEAFGELETAAASYNEAAEAMREHASEVAAAIEDYVSERSENWQASDAADTFANWADAWTSFYVEDYEPCEADDAEVPDEADVDDLPLSLGDVE